MKLKKQADIGPLLTDENDRYISDGDIHEYIYNLALEEWGPDVDLLVQQYVGLYNSARFEAADKLLDEEPTIQGFLNLREEMFARFSAAKAGPGSKKFVKFIADLRAGKRSDSIDELMRNVMSPSHISRNAKAVKDAARYSVGTPRQKKASKSVLARLHELEKTSQQPRRKKRYYDEPQQEAGPDLTPWLLLQSRMKAENPALLTALTDYFDLPPYARQAHLQRNPDFARWLTTIPAIELQAYETMYFIWAKQIGRMTQRQEARVTRNRPALATTLRVYKPRSARTGL